jgi:hypothetical protein
MSSPRNPTVHVPIEYEYEPVFHTTTRCPRIPPATEALTRSAARREGMSECPRCFEARMRRVEREQSIRVEGRSSRPMKPPVSVSGFSDFIVD